MSLIMVMVWVLTKDDGLDSVKWRVSRPERNVNGTGTMLEDMVRHTNCKRPPMEGRSSCQPQLQSSGISSGQEKTWS